MVVFGGAYHSGFNFGFNIAQAINYATTDWLRQVVDARSCECSRHSVKASVYQIYKNLLTNPDYNKTRQFLAFQKFIYLKAEQDDSDEELEEAKQGVSLEFSKKIKKAKNAPRKVVFKNEEYDISNWAQCGKCKLWRIVRHLPT